MIQVTIGTNLDRRKVIVEDSATPKQVMIDNDVDYSVATVHLDGAIIDTAEMNKPLSSFGITETCMLIAVVKDENA